MKRKWLVPAMLLAAAVLAAALLYGREGFTGSRVKDETQYCAEFQAMHGSDRHTLSLTAGDTLTVHLQAEAGKLTLELQAPDGTTVYTGNGTEATDFTVTVPQSGDYTILLQAKHAKGSVEVRLAP